MAIRERADPTSLSQPRETSSIPLSIKGPVWCGNHPVWTASKGDLQIRFVGRGLGGTRPAILRRVEGEELPVAQAKQVHSDTVLSTRALESVEVGEGDALWTDRRGLVLSVITADCVPILLAEEGGDRIAAVHAGWRGIVSGVVPRTIEALGAARGSLEAWIGPSIGVCCYEVGEDVAAAVVGATSSRVMQTGEGTGERPHLDLAAAARHQLAEAGVESMHTVAACTHCDPERLWSYRREGSGVGRNLAYVWRRV